MAKLSVVAVAVSSLIFPFVFKLSLQQNCLPAKINGFVWESYEFRPEYGFSRPLCFNKQNNPVYQKCSSDGKWLFNNQSLAGCKGEIIRDQGIGCPFGMQSVEVSKSKVICLNVTTSPTHFSERTCYGSDTNFFQLKDHEKNAVIKYLRHLWNPTLSNSSIQFWLPAKRMNTEFSPVVWRIPGSKWGETLTQPYDENNPARCIRLTVSYEGHVFLNMTNCRDKLQSVCVYKQQQLLKMWCPSGYLTMRYLPDKCFGKNSDNFELVDLRHEDFLLMQKNNLFKPLAKYLDLDSNDLCLLYKFPLENNELLPVVLSEKGEMLPFEFFNCVIDVERITATTKNPRMTLSFNADKETLVLTVYDRNRLWLEDDDDDTYGIECFTNADYHLVRNVEIKELFWEESSYRKSMFQLKMYGEGPGYYWCEAHTIHNFELIISEPIVADKKQKGHAFAFLVDLPCVRVDCHNYSRNMKNYGKYVENMFKNAKNGKEHLFKFLKVKIHSVRIMKIENVTSESLRVLCHITASTAGSDVDNSSEESSEEDNDAVFHPEMEIRSKLRASLSDILGILTQGKNMQVNSTDFCFSEISQPANKKWQPTKIGSSTTTYEICLQKNGLPITRKCLGDFLYGAAWEQLRGNIRCLERVVATERIVTDDLYKIVRDQTTQNDPGIVVDSIKNILIQATSIIPADLYYLGVIMMSLANRITSRNFTVVTIDGTEQLITSDTAFNKTDDIITIYNSLMEISTRITQSSARLNSTSILLEAFEKIINDLPQRGEILLSSPSQPAIAGRASNASADGVTYKVEKNIMVFEIDPSFQNVSGVAVYRKRNNYNTSVLDFRDCDFRFLYSNQSGSDLLEEANLEIATFFPEDLLSHLDEVVVQSNSTTSKNQNPVSPIIIIKIFLNDHLLQSERSARDIMMAERVVSVTLPGYDSELPGLLPVFIRTNVNSSTNDTDMCRYWNYNEWKDDGMTIIAQSGADNNVTWCGCSHLTPFAYLVAGSFNLTASNDDVIITKVHQDALDIITVLGCSLSFIGVFGIVVTAVIFQSWREKPGSKVLLQLSAAIAFQMILFCFVNTEVLTGQLLDREIFTSCIVLGALLHYSVLVQFAWMLIVAYLQYKRYVEVLGSSRPTRFFLKSFLLGWILPIFPVLMVVLIDRQSYIPVADLSTEKICYPTGNSLYFGVILPVVVIIIANLVIFILVIYNVVRGPDKKVRHVDRKLAVSQIRLSVLLFFLLGLTWIFGLLASTKAGLVFSYLFCLTATIQGFILFIYFVVLDPVTRKLWSNFLMRIFNKDHSK